MILSNNSAGVAQINTVYLATSDAKLANNIATWEAYKEVSEILYGKGRNLDRLKELSRAHPNDSTILNYLARAYAKYGEHTQAASTYEAAASAEVDANEKARLQGLTAAEYAKAGLIDKVKPL